MAFTDIFFIARFLPLFLIAYYLAPNKYKDAILFGGSLIFYAYGSKKMVFLLLVLVIANYFLGRILVKPKGVREVSLPDLMDLDKVSILPDTEAISSRKRKLVLALAVLLDAGVLIFFKVGALTTTTIALPLGLSFYIFKMISYQADLYTGKIKMRPTFVRTAAYFTMFPQIAEGPIMGYSQGSFDRLHGRTYSYAHFEAGVEQAVCGIAMKLLLADRIGILWNEIGKIGYESISTPLAWMGMFAYTFQLYFDFWGYSLIASGLGMMLGFPEVINFDHPYASRSIGEFYRRWHATLGTWFKNYIYFPMGGSRVSTVKIIRNLLVVWAVTGLWHGGTLNFLVWGLVLGLIIILEKFLLKGLMDRFPIWGRLHVWILIPMTWVVFAITDFSQIGIYFGRLLPFFHVGKSLDHMDWVLYLKQYGPYFIASIILCFPGVSNFVRKHRKNPIMIGLMLLLFWISMFFAVTSQGNSFMYFSF